MCDLIDGIYWGYIEICLNGGDDCGCNGDGISMEYDNIEEMIKFEELELGEELEGLRNIIGEMKMGFNDVE